MKIGKYDIPQKIIQDYLFAIKWNQSHGTDESDQQQVDAHDEILKFVGLNRKDIDNEMCDEVNEFIKDIDKLVNDLLIKGY